MVKKAGFKKVKSSSNHIKSDVKSIRLSPCDVDILKLLKSGPIDVINIHEHLESNYSDQEISLHLSWLEERKFVKKIITTHLGGYKTISYQLDGVGREYLNKQVRH